ncbi:HAD-like domain [Pseudocohnilembus persalinus]|uniref:Mitochondrial import inner membrane translocase subunit TIM50 n=1 Tax=Pseudocohnilembus persalinus TaxID=266149 RepID=A0A0V0QW56_PSEPJ|nr:HAD-like domain [Pseudocohnilembus persalinus]|eukprot:KRX06117.1 HAD-like domain [Pseudocohnilembus persalinus]
MHNLYQPIKSDNQIAVQQNQNQEQQILQQENNEIQKSTNQDKKLGQNLGIRSKNFRKQNQFFRPTIKQNNENNVENNINMNNNNNKNDINLNNNQEYSSKNEENIQNTPKNSDKTYLKNGQLAQQENQDLNDQQIQDIKNKKENEKNKIVVNGKLIQNENFQQEKENQNQKNLEFDDKQKKFSCNKFLFGKNWKQKFSVGKSKKKEAVLKIGQQDNGKQVFIQVNLNIYLSLVKSLENTCMCLKGTDSSYLVSCNQYLEIISGSGYDKLQEINQKQNLEDKIENLEITLANNCKQILSGIEIMQEQFKNQKQIFEIKFLQLIRYKVYSGLKNVIELGFKQIYEQSDIQYTQVIEYFAKRVQQQKIITGPVGPFNGHKSNCTVLNTEVPFLPKMDEKFKYTVVLDMDETLIHYFEKGENSYFKVRPFCDIFLQEMSEMYELVIFTAGISQYANWVMDTIDPKGYVKYRLYRQHCIQTNNFSYKDLNKLGRNLKRTIIVDNVKDNFRLHKQNGIEITSWFSDTKDTALKDFNI